MATDPVTGVQSHEPDSPLDLNLDRVIRRLAALQPSPRVPYLTVSLDWRPDGSAPGRTPREEPLRSQRHVVVDDSGPARRPSRQQFDRDSEEVLARYGPHGEAFDSLTADLERIRTYLDSELDPSAHGVVIVACNALSVFEPVALSLPVPNRIDVAPIPALSVLAQMHDDHPTYAVLLADQKDATLAVISLATLGHSLSIEGTDFPRHQQQGGWSQRRYQMRADERAAAFIRAVADRTRTLLDEQRIQLLVLAGEEVNTTALMDAFHQTVRDRVVGSVRMDIRASDTDLIEASLPLIDESERRREQQLVRRLADGIGSDGLATADIEDTLAALQVGQVDTLVMADDLHAAGWADYELNLFGAGLTPSQHPTGGDANKIVPVALEQEVIRLALSTGADVEIVQSSSILRAAELETVPEAGSEPPRSQAARQLDDFGAVGALLRFTLTESSQGMEAGGA